MSYSEGFEKACKEGDSDTAVNLLLQVDVNQQDINGKTPLHYACEAGHPNILKLLLTQEKLNIDIQDTNGKTPLFWLLEHKELSDFILPMLNRSQRISLHEFGKDKMSQVFQHFLHSQRLLHKQIDLSGEFADVYEKKLISARGKLLLSELEHGSEAAARTLFQNNFLHACCLVMDANEVNKSGRFEVLDIACQKGYIDFVKVLLAHQSIDWSEMIPDCIMTAAKHKHIEIGKVLLSQPGLNITDVFVNLPMENSIAITVKFLLSSDTHDQQSIVAYVFEKCIPCITSVGQLLGLLDGIGVGAGDTPGSHKKLAKLRNRSSVGQNFRETNDSEIIARAIFEQAKVILAAQGNELFSEDEYNQYRQLFDRCIVRRLNQDTREEQNARVQWLENEVKKQYQPENISNLVMAAVKGNNIERSRKLLLQPNLNIIDVFVKLPIERNIAMTVKTILSLNTHDQQSFVAAVFEKCIPAITKVEQLLTLLDAIGVDAGNSPGSDKRLAQLRKRPFRYRETNDSEKIARAIFKRAKDILAEQGNKLSSEDEYRQYRELLDRCIVRKPNRDTKKAREARVQWLEAEVEKDYELPREFKMI